MPNRPSSPGSLLAQLVAERQSIWLDYIHRRMLQSGELKTLIERRAVRGVTSNPTIFEQAMGQGDTYDEAIARLASEGKDTQAIYEALAIEDIRGACDLFRPIYEMSAANDGYVSMEVSPRLAHDADRTIAEARRLWQAIGRPNAMIKIPGTAEGLPAVSQALAEGINVNVTLLFSVAMYERVIDAYITGLERRAAAGQPIETVRSVASFFVSRVDIETDKRLAALGTAAASALMGTAAVANAKLAYSQYTAHFEGDRFRQVMAKGAAVQRPLWASTGTKNPAYPDTKYVDGLIGPDTVNTMPPATLEAFADHGTAHRTIDEDVDRAREQVAAIEALGIRLSDVTDFLVSDGVKKFADSFTQLLMTIDAKRVKLAAAGLVDQPLAK